MKTINSKDLFGFGTHRLKGVDCYRAVRAALEAGYNLIDTAEKYDNSRAIGDAIIDSERKREDIYIVHKLTDVEEFSRSTEETNEKVKSYLEQLQTNYIDILLMHGPSPRYHEQPELFKEGNINVWRAMIWMRDAGVLKHIGVSNFNISQICYLFEATGVLPEYLEIEYNAVNADEIIHIKNWCDRAGIKIIGYSPIVAGEIYKIEEMIDYKYYHEKYDMTPGEYALRFCLSHNVIPIPRSSNEERIKQNLSSLKKGPLKP